MLSKEKFVEIISQLQEVSDLQYKISDEIRKCRKLDTDFLDGYGYIIAHEDIVVDLLRNIMNDDKEDNIRYFMYEIDYGREYEPGMIKDKDGNEIDFSSAEKLYDYLLMTNVN